MIPAVSVIVPVYGVEKYIERCARSLFEQTLDDIEYIFVNDCTEDASIDVLKKVMDDYPERREQTHIVSMCNNSGQAAVRAKGIEFATGEYVIHCDSDDFVDLDIYRVLYSHAKEGGFDIVTCDYYEGDDSRWIYRRTKVSRESGILEDILLMPMGGSLCNKLVRRSIVQCHRIHPPIENIAEDLAFSLQYADSAGSYGHVPSPLYYYYVRHGSAIRNHAVDSVLESTRQHVTNLNLGLSYLNDKFIDDNIWDCIVHHKLGVKNNYLQFMKNPGFTKLWRNTFAEINSKVLCSKRITKKEKMTFIIAYLGLYPLFYRLIKR